jgi:plastocyanin
MKRVLILIALGVLFISGLLAAVSCGSSSQTTSTAPGTSITPGATADITIENFAFSPDTITVAVGSTVTWTNKDSTTHTVTSLTGVFDSGEMSHGSNFSHTFNQKGTFEYRCGIHTSMRGTVTVE